MSPKNSMGNFFKEKSVSSFTGQDPFEMFGTPRDAFSKAELSGTSQGCLGRHVVLIYTHYYAAYLYTVIVYIYIYLYNIYIHI